MRIGRLALITVVFAAAVAAVEISREEEGEENPPKDRVSYDRMLHILLRQFAADI